MTYGSLCLCFAIAAGVLAILVHSRDLNPEGAFESTFKTAGCQWTGTTLYNNTNYKNQLKCTEKPVEKVETYSRI